MQKFLILLAILAALTVTVYLSGCTQPSEMTCGQMSLDEAIYVAENSNCLANDGRLKAETAFCNENTKTWWIDLDTQAPEGCNPACVVNVETGQAGINWRCTGLIQPTL